MEKERKENGTEEGKKRTPIQRALALGGVILLLGLYVVTFVAALTSSPSANGLFLASLTCTLVIPLAIYVLRWLVRVFGGKRENHK